MGGVACRKTYHETGCFKLSNSTGSSGPLDNNRARHHTSFRLHSTHFTCNPRVMPKTDSNNACQLVTVAGTMNKQYRRHKRARTESCTVSFERWHLVPNPRDKYINVPTRKGQINQLTWMHPRRSCHCPVHRNMSSMTLSRAGLANRH